MNQCLISFGSNLGDRNVRLAEAARRVCQSGLATRFATSRQYETPPIGGPGGQEPFLNAVAAFDTDASASDILRMLQSIESDLGRHRIERWGARSIDLDVVLHGELIGGGTALVVPHPRYTARRFVLRPACDVASHYRDPRFGWTLEDLADHLDQGAASLALVGANIQARTRLGNRLHQDFGIQIFSSTEELETAKLDDSSVWVSTFAPALPTSSSALHNPKVPRLIARIQRTTEQNRWPAPHQMWPASWDYPEYRLELDDVDWAVNEVKSALDSMRCPLHAVTETGDWW